LMFIHGRVQNQAMNGFHADIDMRALESMFLIAPTETRKAVARLLNDEAFSYKSITESVLSGRYIIRNRAFVRSMLRVDKADATRPPSSQRAIAGSIRTSRFTGWAEVVPGGPAPERGRIVGTNARADDPERKALQGNRLLSGLTFERPSNYDEIPERMRIPAMISMLARNPDYTAEGKGMFIIQGGNWVPGLYKFKSKGQMAKWRKSRKGDYTLVDKRTRDVYDRPEVQRVQTFGKAPQGESFNWPLISIGKLQAWFDPRETWLRYFGEIVRKAVNR